LAVLWVLRVKYTDGTGWAKVFRKWDDLRNVLLNVTLYSPQILQEIKVERWEVHDEGERVVPVRVYDQ